jgi:hypothetical protein
MLPTVDKVKKIMDDPNNRTVTAYFTDNTSVIIKDISYENYTVPPGYKDRDLTSEYIQPLMVQRKLLYYTSLSAQLINTQQDC